MKVFLGTLYFQRVGGACTVHSEAQSMWLHTHSEKQRFKKNTNSLTSMSLLPRCLSLYTHLRILSSRKKYEQICPKHSWWFFPLFSGFQGPQTILWEPPMVISCPADPPFQVQFHSLCHLIMTEFASSPAGMSRGKRKGTGLRKPWVWTAGPPLLRFVNLLFKESLI